MNTDHKGSGDEISRKAALSKRLEDFGWAVLLIVIGTIWLMPEKLMPKGSWLIAVGLIMLGLNAIRYFMGIRMVGFSLVAGSLALLAGFGEFFDLTLPSRPIQTSPFVLARSTKAYVPGLGSTAASLRVRFWVWVGLTGRRYIIVLSRSHRAETLVWQ